MRGKKCAESRDGDGASDQKQDPLERRRLQNRLSQRNHRRKIRDRIAKLQERVIANELRAAAALNGWDQPCSPPPLIGNRHAFQQDNAFGHDTSDGSISSTESFSNFGSSYGFSTTSPWPGGAVQSSAFLSGDSTWLWNIDSSPTDTAYSTSSLSDLMGDGTNQPFLRNNEEQIVPEMLSASSPHSSGSFTIPTNQPLYYTVTENALPQILHVLSNASPQSKIIILVSPDSVSSGVEKAISASLPANNGVQDLSQPTGSVPNSICQCQSQSTGSTMTSLMGTMAWGNPATSYLSGCQSKVTNTIGGTLSGARM